MKRRVEITVGMPDGFEEKDESIEGLPHPDESYYVNFVEEISEDEVHGFTAQSGCLCTLQVGTQAWLNWASEEETQALMDAKHEEDDEK